MENTQAEQEKKATPEQGKVVEKRVGTRVIRRRRKAKEPEVAAAAPETASPETSAPDSIAPAASAAEPTPVTTETAPEVPAAETGATAASTDEAKAVQPTPPATQAPKVAAGVPAADAASPAAKDKARKSPSKRKSKAEWESEDIKKAGGLLGYAAEVDVAGEEPAFVEQEPGEGFESVSPEMRKKLSPAVKALPKDFATGGTGVVGQTRAPGVPMERVFRPSGNRRKKTLRRDQKKTRLTEVKASKRVIRMEEAISVSELSKAMGVKANYLIQQLMELDIMVTINQTIDVDTATIIAQEHGYDVTNIAIKEDDLLAAAGPVATATEEGEAPAEKVGETRPPVVTVMGHVDHGKTSLLDAIRSSTVADGEAGGITQHIGASEVVTEKGAITFLDTPGHEAFTALRARGAQVTDVVILVVAADDGVMPQTIEAINHAKAAGVPIVVAINKMDKEEANPERVTRELSEHGLIPEDWGGDTVLVPTSAETRAGIDNLLDMVLLQAEMLDLRADPKAGVRGVVVEARLDKGRGPMATVVIESGTLKRTTPVVCGSTFGRVRALINDKGQTVKEVGPGHAVEILGLDAVPTAGDPLEQAADERSAKVLSESRARKEREAKTAAANRPVSLEDFMSQTATEDVKVLPIIVKADVQGSAEAVVGSLEKVSTDVAKIKILHTAMGGVTESDVLLAAASNAMIIGFNVRPESKARKVAETEKVQIKSYSIIYELIDDVRKALAGLLEPNRVEKVLGHAEVREAFHISKVGTIAGCIVKDGKILRSAHARLLRDSVVIFEGEVASLKRFKDDAKEVDSGFECGIGLENYNDVKAGDVIESYIIEEIAAEL